MRFAHAHKLSTYLMVACAFLALTLSGELPAPVVLMGALGIVVSWRWEPPRIRFERFSMVWTILSLLVLSYTVFLSFSGGDLLLAGGQFLIYLLVAKLCNRRSCKDYLHVYVITFLMLVAGTVLNAEFTYGLFFLGYVIAATWALILFHLRREMEDNFLLKHSDDLSSERVEVTRILNSRRIVGRRFFVGTSLVSLGIFVFASLLFLSVPRIGFGLFFQKNRSGITMTGFSDGVQLGGHGTIKTDTTVVMRVEVGDDYRGRRAPYLHWRGVAFDLYQDGEWRRSRDAPRTARLISFPQPGKERYYLLYDQGAPPVELLRERAEAGVRQEIYLEPIGYDVMFGASMPLAFEFDAKIGTQSPRTERNDELRYAHAAGMRYAVYSAVDPPAPEILRAATGELPDGYERYLQVPPEITAEVRNLAHEITRDARTDYDKAVAVEAWLKDNLSYSLRMESPGRTEPLHFFLLQRKQGHCEYFSSAMAILLRLADVPTRNVNGFFGGEWNEYNGYIAVRAGDAHSWLEVYFPGVGWVTFDPTPSAEIDRLGRGGTGVRDRMRRLMDTFRFQWFKWVIEYDLYRQVSLFRGMRESLRGSTDSMRETTRDLRRWLGEHARAMGAVAALLVAGIALVAWRRRRAPGAAGQQGTRSRDPMTVLYLRVLDRLARRGYRRDPSVTPREHAHALAAANAPGARPFDELTDLYYQAVFGARSTPEMMARARALGAAIDEALAQARRARRGEPSRLPAAW